MFVTFSVMPLVNKVAASKVSQNRLLRRGYYSHFARLLYPDEEDRRRKCFRPRRRGQE